MLMLRRIWFPNWESNANVRQSTLASSSYQQQIEQSVSSSQGLTSQRYYESPRPQYYTPPPVLASDPRYNYSSSQAPVTSPSYYSSSQAPIRSSSYYSSSQAPPSRDLGGPRYQGPSMLDPPNRARSQVLPTRSAYQEPNHTSGDCDSCQKDHGSCARCVRENKKCVYDERASPPRRLIGSPESPRWVKEVRMR
jgi:hypothetical protein